MIDQTSSPFVKALIIMASLVIVIAGIKSASVIIVPFLLSVFIALLCLPPMKMMQARGLPMWTSLIVVIAGVIIVSMLMGWLIGNSIESFNRNLPEYQQKISGQWIHVIAWMQSAGLALPQQFAAESLDPSSAMRMIAGLLSGFGNVLANSFLILLTVIFILLEAGSFGRKITSIGWAHGTTDEIVERLRMYMSIKTTMSAVTGLLVTLVLWSLGVDYPVLWGVLAFMFNYVPNIGSIIAAVPAVLLALVQIDAMTALLVAVAYTVINIVIGSVLEPKYMGKGLGLSALVVFLSLVFWGWVLGPVGMLLSVPLTVSVKLILDANENTRWFGQLLGHSD